MRILLFFLLAATSAADELYQRDVEFFLDEFEEQAGHFFETKGIDWDKVRAWAGIEVAKVGGENDHLQLCARLVARLRDGHARLTDCQVEWPDESEGRPWRHPKIRMLLQGEKALVISVDPALGIPIGSEITTIDGAPVSDWVNATAQEWSDRRGFSTRRHLEAQVAAMGLGGWEGTQFKAGFVKPDGSVGEVEVDRSLGEKSNLRLDVSKQLGEVVAVGRNGWGKTKAGNGYIRLRKVPGDLPQQLDQMLSAIGDVPGMILDMRANSGGGCDHYAVFARFIAKGEYWGRVEGKGQRPFPGPLVVIVDASTASAGETLAGQFGEDQRAIVIGPSATAGMSSQKVRLRAPSGLCTAYFSVRSNKGRFNRGKGLEGIGV
ncbi:MAG: S41 family peptidase, partial [Verrucomicrobiales bacterium]